VSPEPKDRLEDALNRARKGLNGAAGPPFPTAILPEDEAGTKATVPGAPANAPVPADNPPPDDSGRDDDRGGQGPADPGDAT
jgi:hypothetical protein